MSRSMNTSTDTDLQVCEEQQYSTGVHMVYASEYVVDVRVFSRASIHKAHWRGRWSLRPHRHEVRVDWGGRRRGLQGRRLSLCLSLCLNVRMCLHELCGERLLRALDERLSGGGSEGRRRRGGPRRDCCGEALGDRVSGVVAQLLAAHRYRHLPLPFRAA